MKIRKFWAKGFRSLQDVMLPELGDVNVFYGPNGSGKSNVIDAMQTFFGIMPIAVDTAYGTTDERLSFREGGRQAAQWIREDDFYARSEAPPLVLMGAVIEDQKSRFDGVLFEGKPVERVEVEIRFASHGTRPDQFSLQLTRLYINYTAPGLPFERPEIRDLLQGIVPQAFTHLGVTRTLASSTFREGTPIRPPVAGTIPDGEVVRELFQAKNAKDRRVRERFDHLREFMASTLHRGEFDVFMDPETQSLELRERLPEPNPLRRDIPVDRAGHGVVQMYAIVASILLAAGRLVAIRPRSHRLLGCFSRRWSHARGAQAARRDRPAAPLRAGTCEAPAPGAPAPLRRRSGIQDGRWQAAFRDGDARVAPER